MNALLHKPTKILVTGRSGSGKSSYLQWFILNHTSSYHRIFIYDDEGEFSERLKITPLTNLGEITNDAFGQVVCFQPESSQSIQDAFDDFCLFVFEYAKAVKNKKCLLVIDELQAYVNAYSLPDSFMDCVHRGRRHLLDCLLASQQANLIHNAIRSQLTELVCFAQGDVNAMKFAYVFGVTDIQSLSDLHYFRKRIGTDGIIKGHLEFEGKTVKIFEKKS